VYGTDGQVEDGLATLTEALDFVGSTGERYYEAELYRLQGELTLQTQRCHPAAGNQTEAQASFHKALTIARHQEAKSLELRAATSLARLWQQQGKQSEACELLAPVYNWFTEGFDTADLKDAKALLDELSEGV
jgi:predicted ATPase